MPLPSEAAMENGEVFTRRWVVDLILDLVGYTPDKDLAKLRICEPACGAGAFLGPMVERLSASCRAFGRSLLDAQDAIAAFDLLGQNVEHARGLLIGQLVSEGWNATEVSKVVDGWVIQGDYLLAGGSRPTPADFVVGNPPYIRLEDVPDERMAAYRSACPTMGGRADIYVAPAYEESFGLAALEARAAGLPVVAMESGGVREFVAHGVEGFLCGDDDAMVSALTALAADPGLRAAISDHNASHRPVQDWSGTLAGFEAAYGAVRRVHELGRGPGQSSVRAS